MVEKNKKLTRLRYKVGMIGIITIILIAFYIKSNPKLSVFTETNLDPNQSDFDLEITNLLTDKLNYLGIPGMQVTIMLNNDLHNYYIGTIDYKRTEKVTEDNVFRIGSVTKIFTATLVLQLAEEGYLNLEDTIDKWFPDIPHSKNITIRSLLNHTSGIYNYTEDILLAAKTFLNSNKKWTPDDLYSYTLKGQPSFKPGEDHRYSNSNYLLLGLICEETTGRKYEELLHEKIIDPLDLKHTYIPPYDEIPVKLVEGYDRDVIPLGINKIKTSNTSWSSMAYSAGALISNCTDLVKFINSLFKEELISSQSLEEMMDFIACTDEDIPVQTGYGLGLRRLEIDGNTLIGHTGTIPGYGGLLMHNLEKNYSIAVLANISYLDQITILTELIDHLTDLIPSCP